VKGQAKGRGLGGATAADDEDDDGDAVEQLFNKAPADAAARAAASNATDHPIGAAP
jgi:hypothetical protein